MIALEVGGIVSIFGCCLLFDSTGWVVAPSSLFFQLFVPSLPVVVNSYLGRVVHELGTEIVLALLPVCELRRFVVL